MELVNKEIGQEGNAVLEIAGGNIVLTVKLDTAGLGASISATLNSDYFFDKLAEKIPGQIDDAVIALFKQAIKAL